MSSTVASTRARAISRNRTNFEPDWERRLHRMARYTLRTALFVELFGLDPAAKGRIKEAIDRLYEELGVEMPPRPRGERATYESSNFLDSNPQRLDAAYLVSLHYPHGAGEFSEGEICLGRTLDKLLATYDSYIAVRYRDDHTSAAVSFETYVQVIKGIKVGGLELHTCSECNTRHVVQAVRLGHAPCPACVTYRLDMKKARDHFDAMISRRRANNQRALSSIRSA